MKNSTEVISVSNLSKGNFVLRVQNLGYKFNPGQFFSIGLSDVNINREYSVASSSKKDYIDFFIREVEEGSLSPYLRNLKKGDKVKILGPYGEFYLKKFDPNTKYMFIATGTGLAPFISIIDDFKIKNYSVFHGIRYLEDAFLEFNWENYNVAVSREKNLDKINNNKINDIKYGYVDLFVEKIEVDESMSFFLCGNSLMVSNIYDKLLEKSINPQKIFTEIFF